MRKVLLATRNRGKVLEYAEMLEPLEMEWLDLGMLDLDLDVDESGSTFEENAIMKAKTFATATGLLTLGDDSGLEVDALDGRPGVRTARYGGEGLSPRQRYLRLLEELEGVDPVDRQARFRCAIALVDQRGVVGTAEGVCEGRIALQPSGEAGFGYDPVFLVGEGDLTMAELGSAEKHEISHRGVALKNIYPLLKRLTQGEVTE